MDKIVVTGLRSFTSYGAGTHFLWHKLKRAESAISLITRFDTIGYRMRIGGEILEDVSSIPGLNVSGYSRNAQFAL